MKKQLASLCVVWGMVFFAQAKPDSNLNESSVADTPNPFLSAKQQAVAKHPLWLKLLYYKGDAQEGDAESFVDDDRFFFAANGKFDPKAEFIATLSAFKNSPETQCSFPARKKWLATQLPEFIASLPKADCAEYDLWRKDLNTESVILVYASSQLNSPSSMYGHTFIRFDPFNVEKHSTYLSHAINFGANIPPDVNSIAYTIKGLGGGYPGNFAANPYFEKIKEYNRAENRDLWEYKLNLTAQEIDLMLAHVWELRGINFDYYFFDENCAYRLLELIDIARPSSKLTDEFPGVVIPIDTVRVVRDKGMVDDVHYRPSHRTHLDNQLNHLPKENRKLAVELSEDIQVRDSKEFKALNIEQQQKIVHASYRLIRYLTNKEERSPEVSKRSFQLLKMIRKHASILPPEPEQPYRPDLGHETTMMSVQVGESNDELFSDFTYRASYHDLLDNIDGYDNGMSLNMAKITLRVVDDSVQLQQAELLDITSLSPRKDYFSPWSWQANIGIERHWLEQNEDLAVQANGGGGVSWELFEQDRLYFMATGRLEYNEGLDNNWSVAPGVEAGYMLTSVLGKSLLKVSQYVFIDGITRKTYQFEHSIALGQDFALRLHAKRNNNDDVDYDEFGLSMRAYF
ncbi:DUF4105 domain-containing protein [Thalassomonas sp. M1454]|uniref:Lnb N-terminal periplasmic domain-containing protein n=1 Tax=Thalassomonas sp. M1454 TaxID=2594477 RepID=UPI00117D8A7E|nr:DUF4105 domain-containing protein [Thalassomonas sp. M1454]TRX56536.1 DUF4105 domain-containing protein [Thalassomonas sp. M1454]